MKKDFSFEQIIDQIPATARSLFFVGESVEDFAREFHARYPTATLFCSAVPSDATSQNMFDTPAEVVVQGADIRRRAIAQKELDGFTVDVVIAFNILLNEERLKGSLHEIYKRVAQGGLFVLIERSRSHWSHLAKLLSKDPLDFSAQREKHSVTSQVSRQQIQAALIEAGFEVEREVALTDGLASSQALIDSVKPLVEHLGIELAVARANLLATHQVIRALKGKPDFSLTLRALCLKPMAGVNEARVDYPLKALRSLPNVTCEWNPGTLSLPRNIKNGVILFHRQFLASSEMLKHLGDLAQKGWTLVSEIDDNPYHWKQYVESDFVAFRGVHAVSVSTKPLAELIRQWNPNLAVFENAIFRLPERRPKPAETGDGYRIFFGALNRQSDWEVIRESVLSACRLMRDKVTLVIIHDRQIFDSIGDGIKKEFHPTLSHDDYLEELSKCDLALLPLQNTEFNRYKSDLKLIECCAAGAVPIFSSVVYGDVPRHSELGLMMDEGADWGEAIVRACDPAFLEAKRALGMNYVINERMHHHLAKPRLDWFSEIVANRVHLEEERQRRLIALG